ncbi:MAG TPA: hypothetical protein VF773_02895 [Verrucomicrobiae bacterium]
MTRSQEAHHPSILIARNPSGGIGIAALAKRANLLRGRIANTVSPAATNQRPARAIPGLLILQSVKEAEALTSRSVTSRLVHRPVAKFATPSTRAAQAVGWAAAEDETGAVAADEWLRGIAGWVEIAVRFAIEATSFIGPVAEVVRRNIAVMNLAARNSAIPIFRPNNVHSFSRQRLKLNISARPLKRSCAIWSMSPNSSLKPSTRKTLPRPKSSSCAIS